MGGNIDSLLCEEHHLSCSPCDICSGDRFTALESCSSSSPSVSCHTEPKGWTTPSASSRTPEQFFRFRLCLAVSANWPGLATSEDYKCAEKVVRVGNLGLTPFHVVCPRWNFFNTLDPRGRRSSIKKPILWQIQ